MLCLLFYAMLPTTNLFMSRKRSPDHGEHFSSGNFYLGPQIFTESANWLIIGWYSFYQIFGIVYVGAWPCAVEMWGLVLARMSWKKRKLILKRKTPVLVPFSAENWNFNHITKKGTTLYDQFYFRNIRRSTKLKRTANENLTLPIKQ